jgi:hypothetical protein
MADVSGPGAYSARTDLGLTGGNTNPNSQSYGEATDMQNLKSAAPLAGTAPLSGGQGAAAPSGPPPDLVPLTEGSRRPDEYITEGANWTPGQSEDDPTADAASLDPSLVMVLLRQASMPDATPAFQRMVRQVYSNL